MDVAADPVDRPDLDPVGVAGRGARQRGWARVWTFLPELTAVLVSIWAFRSVAFDGRLPGNIGDARWTISLHEHWYRVWSGREAIRDLHFYFPLPKTLGTSDAFLVQGQLYSLARLVGLSAVDSWVVAGFAFFLVGALGVAVLGRRLLDARWLQVSFVLLCVGSYAMQNGFAHVQLFGMLSASWIFVGLHDLVIGRHVRRAVWLLVAVPPLLALSSWYAMLLTAVILGFLALALALVSSLAGIGREVRQVSRRLWESARSVPGIIQAAVLVLLWAAVLWVYLPSMGLLPKPQWLEVQIYSPRWSDLWNASEGGGGIWSALYDRLPLDGSLNDQTYGFTPVVFVCFTVAGLAALRGAVLGRRQERQEPREAWSIGRAGLLAASLTIVAVLALFLVDERGFSLFQVLWRLVPGMDSIRSPFRVMIILFGLVVLVILRAFELWWQGRDRSGEPAWRRPVGLAAAGLLVALMFVEMQRPVDAQWTRAELLSPQLTAQVERIREDCDAVILLAESPDTPTWLTAIDAVILSTESGVPTPQGYSRSDPIGYPDIETGVDPAALTEWMRAGGFDGRACAVSSTGVRVVAGR